MICFAVLFPEGAFTSGAEHAPPHTTKTGRPPAPASGQARSMRLSPRQPLFPPRASICPPPFFTAGQGQRETKRQVAKDERAYRHMHPTHATHEYRAAIRGYWPDA
jgi:hypothetical protein